MRRVEIKLLIDTNYNSDNAVEYVIVREITETEMCEQLVTIHVRELDAREPEAQ